MTISSRTPDGEANFCEVCGNEVVISPSIFPVRDAACPSCGSLLRFSAYYSDASIENSYLQVLRLFLKVGSNQYGCNPGVHINGFLDALNCLVEQGYLQENGDVELYVLSCWDWEDLTIKLRQEAGLPYKQSWRHKCRVLFNKLVSARVRKQLNKVEISK